MPVRRRSDDAYAAALALGEEYIDDDPLDEKERRRRLRQDGENAAQVILDLEGNGVLNQLLGHLRPIARNAYRILAETPPNDVATIAAAQVEVKACKLVLHFIETVLAKADQAESIINEVYGNGKA